MGRRLIIRRLDIYDVPFPHILKWCDALKSKNYVMNPDILDFREEEELEMPVMGSVLYSLDGTDGIVAPILIDDSPVRSAGCSIVTSAMGPVFIRVGKRVLDLAGDDRIRVAAAIYHELGHLVAKHRFKHLKFQHPSARELRNEVTADNYAVRHLGPLPVIDMLLDSYRAVLDATGGIEEEDDELTMGELELVYRIGRLGHRMYRNIFMSYYGNNSKMLRKHGYRPLK